MVFIGESAARVALQVENTKKKANTKNTPVVLYVNVYLFYAHIFDSILFFVMLLLFCRLFLSP